MCLQSKLLGKFKYSINSGDMKHSNVYTSSFQIPVIAELINKEVNNYFPVFVHSPTDIAPFYTILSTFLGLLNCIITQGVSNELFFSNIFTLSSVFI